MSIIDTASSQNPHRIFWRFLVLVHRYVGIAISLIVLLWCVSGTVMMYVQYPVMSSADRLQGLAPFSLPAEVLEGRSAPLTDALVSDFVVEASSPGVVLRARLSNGQYRTLSLKSGNWIEPWDEEALTATAQQYMTNRGWSESIQMSLVERDQWRS